MRRWYLIIDVAKCENCRNCLLACKDEHTGNDWPGYACSQPLHGHRWITIKSRERGKYPLIDVAYLPMPCMHCDSAPCIGAARDGAVRQREDGIVLIDPQKAQGQKQLLNACPYGAIWWNENTQTPQKCTLCAHLLDGGWKAPRCVQACPAGALRINYSDETQMTRLIEEENLQVLNPQWNCRPKVFYKNLFRFNRCFIAGSVSFDNDGAVDCAAGARVGLFRKTSLLREVRCDSFGDFKCDNLPENSGIYRLEISFGGFRKRSIDVELCQSVTVETIHFPARQKDPPQKSDIREDRISS